MKAVIEITVVKNDDGTFSARTRQNWENSSDSLKKVTIDEIGRFVSEKLKEADEDGKITKK